MKSMIDILTKIREASLDDQLALVDLLLRELEVHRRSQSQDTPKLAAKQRIHSTHTVVLTQRQQQVLVLFSQGLSYKQIAMQIGIRSPKAVENHLDAVRRKLSVPNRRECIRKALEVGLI